jgi:hypothetical protein
MTTDCEKAPSARRRIVVLGYIVRGPLGGLAWHHLQYVMGLSRLGHEVSFLEDSGDTEWCCYDPARDLTDADPTSGLAFAAATFERAGLPDVWAYYDAHRTQWHGPLAGRVLDCCRNADLLLNVSGSNRLRPWTCAIPHRVLIDTDPVFTQIRNLTDPDRRRESEQHTAFFSFAENIGLTASIPDDGFPWQPTRQPIVLDAWPVVPGSASGPFTTVMQWDSYSPREHAGRRYGMKSESFRAYLDLPAHAPESFEIAVGGQPAATALVPHGWTVRNPIKAIADTGGYQAFIRHSKAEFSVAKHGYVVSRSGWFSDRSAAYLASGRPVVTEDTGFTDWMPSGNGVLAFRSFDEALAAVTDVNSRYDTHCREARRLAERYFDARAVLPDLLDRVAVTPIRSRT